jgi:hypothetical protein
MNRITITTSSTGTPASYVLSTLLSRLRVVDRRANRSLNRAAERLTRLTNPAPRATAEALKKTDTPVVRDTSSSGLEPCRRLTRLYLAATEQGAGTQLVVASVVVRAQEALST